MELTTVLVTHLHPFSNNVSLDSNALDDALDASLIAFTADIEAAVPLTSVYRRQFARTDTRSR